MRDLIHEALLELPAVEEVPLAVAPLPDYDVGVSKPCPSCGGLDATVSPEDGVATCPDCTAEFVPVTESSSSQLIRRLAARRARQQRQLEALSLSAPPGVNPDDYALAAEIYNELEAGAPARNPAEKVPANR